jgi:flagellar basal-body rod protein FlgF
MKLARKEQREIIVYSAVSGQLAIFKQLDVVANNLANLNTTGFKAERMLFEQALNKQNVGLSATFEKDISAPSNFKTEEFVKVRGTRSDFSQGPIEVTGNKLDVAIQGEGFFVVQTPDGERYTRSGNFRIDETNRLVTQQGFPVQGEGGEITIQGSELSFANNGAITVDNKALGKLRLVKLDPTQTSRDARQLFKLNEGGTPTELTQYTVQGGALEGSNVNAVRELTEMIFASRLFESFQKTQEAGGRMVQARNQYLGTQS